MPFFAEKPQIHNIKNGFYNFNNSNNLISYLRKFPNHERQEKSISAVGRRLGSSWEKVGKPHLWTFGTFPYAHVKIPKPEVLFTETHTRKNFETSLLFYGIRIKIPKPDLIKILKPLPLKIWKPGAVKFYNLFMESY